MGLNVYNNAIKLHTDLNSKNKIQSDHAKRVVHGLKSNERKLLIKMLNDPHYKVSAKDKAVLPDLQTHLKATRDRNEGCLANFSRSIKNLGSRPSSKQVIKAVNAYGATHPQKTPPPPKPTVTGTAKKIHSLTIANYNVLFPQKEGEHASEFSTAVGYSEQHGAIGPNHQWRLKVKTANIINANPQVLALQEVTYDEFKHYATGLKKQGYNGAFSDTHTPSVTHGVALFYKEDRFERLAALKGEFSIQKREADGKLAFYSNGKPVLAKRSHLVLDLKDKESGATIRVASCHLVDPRSFPKKEKASHVQAVVRDVQQKAEYPIDMTVIAGDFNQDQFGDDLEAHKNPKARPVPLASITAFKPLANFIEDKGRAPTENRKNVAKGFNGPLETTGRKIDWIFFHTQKTIEVATLAPDQLSAGKFNGKNTPSLPPSTLDNRGSDHEFVLSKIEFTKI